MVNVVANLEVVCAQVLDGKIGDLAESLSRKSYNATRQVKAFNVAETMFGACQLLLGGDDLVSVSTVRSPPATDIGSLIERHLQSDSLVVEDPWFAERDSGALGFIVVAAASMVIFVLLFEGGFLRSTLVFTKSCSKVVEKELEDIVERSASQLGFLHIHEVHYETHQEHHLDDKVDPVAFWNTVQSIAEGGSPEEASSRKEEDIITFARPIFPTYEADGSATVTVQRRGPCDGVAEVRVATCEEKSKTSFAAKAGTDFEALDSVIRFEHGEEQKSLDVKLIPTKSLWFPTRSFFIELKSIVSGRAQLRPPTIQESQECNGQPTATIKILHTCRFPANIPEEDMNCWYKLVWYYIKDRIHARKRKFWKTMAGKLYDPFHNILVRCIIQKVLIDWAVNPEAGGTYATVIITAGVFLLSTTIHRWGDMVQRTQRGRTGGTRMVHRQQILAKMIMIEHAEHHEVPDCHWFYTALVDVNEVTINAYWQGFKLCEATFGLFLCLCTIAIGCIVKWSRRSRSFEIYLPACAVVLMLPLTQIFFHARKGKNMKLLEKRLQSEEIWVETYGWLAQTGSNLYSMSARELEQLETMYTRQANDFITHHQKSRDYSHDTEWITAWITCIFFVMFMCVGGFRVYQNFESDHPDKFEVGDYVVLMEVYYRFGFYLTQMYESLIWMERSAVSIKNLADLLNLREHKSLHDTKGHVPSVNIAETLELRNVELVLPRSSLGPMGPLQLTKNGPLILPLGKVVMIEGAPERTLMSFLGLVGHILQPTSGKIVRALDLSAKMLPPSPVSSPPRVSVKDSLQSIVGTERISSNFAHALGLDPDCMVDHLGLGQKQVLSLGRGMLLDPDILVIPRPLGCLDDKHKRRVSHLLRAWQTGGANLLISTLASHSSEKSEVATSSSNGHSKDPPQASNGHSKNYLHARTLILTGEGLFGHALNDVSINLHDYLAIGAFDGRFDLGDSHKNPEDTTAAEFPHDMPVMFADSLSEIHVQVTPMSPVRAFNGGTCSV